ncbi:UNVERIFIED_ORG: hypothetical protein ABID57_001242 [Arthrobacter sp. UYEF1]
MYELTSDMQIVRTGTPPVQQVMEQLIPATGDEELDGLLQHAKLKLRWSFPRFPSGFRGKDHFCTDICSH